jgi:hypothetical protein
LGFDGFRFFSRVKRMPASRTIRIKVKPNARASLLEEDASGGIWRAQLRSPPVDGRANEELVGLVAAHFGCRRHEVSIRSGAGGRFKLVRIDTTAPLA